MLIQFWQRLRRSVESRKNGLLPKGWCGSRAGRGSGLAAKGTVLQCPSKVKRAREGKQLQPGAGTSRKVYRDGATPKPTRKWDGWVGVGHGQSCLGKDFLSHGLLTAKTYKIREEIYDFLSFGHREKNRIPNWKMVWSKFRAASLWLWLGDTWEAEQVVFGFQQWVLKVAVLKWNETQGLFQDVLWFLAFQWSIMTC